MTYAQEYYRKNREKEIRRRREYTRNNKEKIKKYNREYYYKNVEILLKKKKEKYRENPEKFKAIQKERVKKEREKIETYLAKTLIGEYIPPEEKQHFDKLLLHKRDMMIRQAKKVLGEYSYRAIEKIRQNNAKKVQEYYSSFPYERYAEPFIKYELRRSGIHKDSSFYADCFDAGMLAYIYSIHNCAVNEYEFVPQYIMKMVRIYIHCAKLIHCDSKNLCRLNNFRESRIESTIIDHI